MTRVNVAGFRASPLRFMVVEVGVTLQGRVLDQALDGLRRC